MKSFLICISLLLLLLTGSPVYADNPGITTYEISSDSNGVIYELPLSGDGAIKTRQIEVTADTELPVSATVLVYYIVRDPAVEEALSSPELLAKYKESHECLDDLTFAELDGSEVYSRFGYSAIWQVIAVEKEDGSGYTLFYDVPESTWLHFENAENKDLIISQNLSYYWQETISAETNLAQYLLTK